MGTARASVGVGTLRKVIRRPHARAPWVLESRMRLEGLSFSSIKSFDGPQSVPLRDLTLIYGPNSSGKSSIFQSILLLKQSVPRAYAAEPGVLEFRGGVADLGGFRTFVHEHDTRRRISINLSFCEAEIASSPPLPGQGATEHEVRSAGVERPGAAPS